MAGASRPSSRIPRVLAVAADGVIYVAEVDGHRIRRIDADCVVTTFAGGGISPTGEHSGFRDGLAAEALFRAPTALTFDHEGNLLVADLVNNLIRRISPDGEVSTIAGNPAGADGSAWNPGTREGHGTAALFSMPRGVAVDAAGEILFIETNHRVRAIDETGYVSTLISTPHYREGGALSPFLSSIAVGPAGEIYIADGGFGRVLRLTSDGVLAIVADREFSIRSWAPSPNGLFVAPDGALYVSDLSTSVIFKITFEDE